MSTILKISLLRVVKGYSSLIALSFFSIILLLARVKLTHSIFFLFLVWNLFLAFTPLAASALIVKHRHRLKKWYLRYPALLAWLLLLPNAPSIITDFVHLYKDNAVPVWFDVLLLTSFTLSGIICGLASMKNIYALLLYRHSAAAANTAMAAICILSGFGLYLGRFLRYNSWDVLRQPLTLMADIFSSLFSAETCRVAWGITIGFGILQYLLFLLYNPDKKI